MKKILYVIGVASLVMFVACQKEDVAQKSIELSASVEQQVEPNATKTNLYGTIVKWVANDEIKVFDNGGKGAKFIAQSSGISSKFNEPTTPERDPDFSESNLSCAIYPYMAEAECSGTNITFNLPATQIYAENSFGRDANVAVGTISAGNITFKNVCGVLKLQLIGSYTVSRIELSGNNDEKLNGSYTVNASSPSMTCTTTTIDEEKVITLDCGTNGVTLSPTTPTTFYFVVPAGAFGTENHGGFTAKIFDINGDAFYSTISTTKTANVINRSKVRAMSSIGVSRISANGYKELSYIANTSNIDSLAAYINTEYRPKSNSEFIIDYKINAISGQARLFGSNGHYSLTSQGAGIYIAADSVYGFWCNKANADYGTWTTTKDQYVTSDRSTISLSNYYFYLNGTRVGKVSEKNQMADDPTAQYMYIFKTNDIRSGRPAQMNLYSFIIKEASSIVKYMIPCKNSSDVPGLYDLVNSQFFTNANTSSSSSFIPGDTIE